MYVGLHVQNLLIWSYFNTIWIFSSNFRKILKYQIPWKCLLWEPNCFMRTDRHDEGNSRF